MSARATSALLVCAVAASASGCAMNAIFELEITGILTAESPNLPDGYRVFRVQPDRGEELAPIRPPERDSRDSCIVLNGFDDDVDGCEPGLSGPLRISYRTHDPGDWEPEVEDSRARPYTFFVEYCRVPEMGAPTDCVRARYLFERIFYQGRNTAHRIDLNARWLRQPSTPGTNGSCNYACRCDSTGGCEGACPCDRDCENAPTAECLDSFHEVARCDVMCLDNGFSAPWCDGPLASGPHFCE